MLFYLAYLIGHFLAMALPLEASYAVAAAIADILYLLSGRDRGAVIKNLKIVSGGRLSDRELTRIAQGVFRNFAKYLVDFFRFSVIDEEYIKRFVKIEGLENVDKARSAGKGVILLSAHIGNWELGGFVLSLLRQPLKAVVLRHENKKVNAFFRKQRTLSNMQPVETGITLRACYDVLKNNGLLAVLGDRDFSKNKKGLLIEFFGHPTLVPKGAAVLSRRLGSAIVPCFMIRQEDDTFRFFFGEPIYPDMKREEKVEIKSLAARYTAVIESYVKRYPSQWYMFREVWNGGQDLGPDTIV